jgi:DNA-binding SARP family transcriptional activator
VNPSVTTPRDAQLELLNGLWYAARQGKPQLCHIEAEAGFGKSWLVRSMAARLEAQRFGHAVAVVSGGPFLPGVLRAAKPWLDAERGAGFLAAARLVLPEERWNLISEDAGEVNAALEIAKAVERSAARLGGACLILEDVHWYSSDDLEALRLLYRRAMAARTNLLIVLTARPNANLPLLELFETDASIADGATPVGLRLEALDEAGIAALSCGVLRSEDLPDGLSAWLLARSEGHPLHAQELLRFLSLSGALRDLGLTHAFVPPRASVPEGLEAVLTARLEAARGEPDLWRGLSALAVLDRGTNATAWARVAEFTLERLEWVSRRGMSLGLVGTEPVSGETRFVLTHPLYPPLLRGLLSETTLKSFLRRAVGVAEGSAERARFARLCDDPDALALTRAALSDAQGRSAWDEALTLTDAILHLEPEAPDRAELELLRGEALFRLGRYEEGLRALVASPLAAAARLACLVYARLGRDVEGFAFANAQLGRFDSGFDFEFRYFWTCFQMRLGMEDSAREWTARLAELAINPEQHSIALYTREWFLKIYEPWRLLVRLEGRQQDLRLENSPPDRAHILEDIAECFTNLREFEQAKETLLSALQLALEHFDVLASHHKNAGELNLETGQPEAARRAFLKSLALARQSHDPIYTAHALFHLARTSFALGNVEDAKRRLEDYEAFSATMDRGVGGGAILFTRPFDLEIAALKLQLELPMNISDSRLHAALGDDALHAGLIHLLRDQPDAALDALTRPTDAAQRPHPTRDLLRGVAHLKRLNFEDAATAFQRSRETAKSQRLEHLESDAEIAFGFCAALRGDETAGRKLVQGGLALLEMTRCTGWVRKWRRLYPNLAERLFNSSVKPQKLKPVRFVRAFGAFGLEENGEVRAWKARKPRELLALLLCGLVSESGPGVARDELITTLWPDADATNGESSFRVTLNRLRESLGDAATIERDNAGRYALKDPKTDLLLFLEALERRDLEAAVAWYAGEFLPGTDLEAVDALRQTLRARWRGAVGQIILESDLTRGAALLERLLEDDGFDLSVLRQLVQHLRELGDSARLTAILERAKKRFQQEIGDVPPELELWLREGLAVQGKS